MCYVFDHFFFFGQNNGHPCYHFSDPLASTHLTHFPSLPVWQFPRGDWWFGPQTRLHLEGAPARQSVPPWYGQHPLALDSIPIKTCSGTTPPPYQITKWSYNEFILLCLNEPSSFSV